jgi:hypothetical protein
MAKDLFNRLKVVDAVEAPALNTNSDTDIVSAIVDRAGYESVLFVIINGALTDAGAVVSVKLEDGDDSGLSDAAAVPTAQIQLDSSSGRMDATPETGFHAAYDQGDDNKSFKIGYLGDKRYLRLTISPVGNAAGDIPLAVTALLGNARHQPAGATQVP